MRNRGRALVLAAAALAVCLLLTLAGARGTFGLALAGVLATAALAAPFVAAFGIDAGPGKARRKYLAVVAAAGLAAGVGAAFWGRGSFGSGLLAVCAIVFLVLPGLAIGLFDHGLFVGGNPVAGRVAPAAFGLVLASSLAVGTGFGGGLALYKWDLRCAKRWVEAIADEVRAEHARTGRYPDSLPEGAIPKGPTPRLIGPDGLSYSAGEEGFRLWFYDDVTTMLDPDEVWYEGVTRRWSRRAT